MILFTLVVLGFCWWCGDQGVVTKTVFTLLVVASFGFLALSEHRYLFHVAQLVLILVIGVSTLGVEWLSQRFY